MTSLVSTFPFVISSVVEKSQRSDCLLRSILTAHNTYCHSERSRYSDAVEESVLSTSSLPLLTSGAASDFSLFLSSPLMGEDKGEGETLALRSVRQAEPQFTAFLPSFVNARS
jgi:hypothetical protein